MKYVIIDAGHNEHIPGKRSFDSSLLEWEFNRDVARRITDILVKTGEIYTHLVWTDCTDPDDDVNERVKVANELDTDILVSIHANAYGNTWNDASGWEIYCYNLNKNSEGYKLAKAIHDESIPFLGIKDRGIKDDPGFAMVSRTNMPAVLIEHGFYTNKKEVELLKSDSFRQKCAEADARGICKYLGVPYPETTEKEPVNEYRQAVKERFGFEEHTLDYLEAYKYGTELLKKLATKG